MSIFRSKLGGLSYGLKLAWMLAKRDVKTRFASSYGGMAWNIGLPMLYALINVVVFSVLMSGRMGLRYGDIPFALFYFVPFMLWQMFSEMVARSTGILREYGFLINKIAFPVWVLPLVPLAAAMLGQAVLVLIIAFLLLQKGVSLGGSAYLFVVLWFACVLLTLGVCYLVSAFAVYVHDLNQVVPVVINILFWLTPILYPATLVEDGGALWLRRIIMDLNPFYYFSEMARQVVFGLADVNATQLFGLLVFSVLVFVLGFCVFRKLKPGFSDVI